MTTNNSINRRTDLLNVSPSGTGAGETGEVRFQELAANGTDYVALKAADSTATQTYTLPDAYPASNGQVLSAQTDGTMSWAAAATGDVSGPVSTTQDALVRWDGTDGTTVADSTITLDGSGNMSGVVSVSSSASVTVEADSLDVVNGNDSTSAAELRLYEASDNGSNSITLKAPDTLSSDDVYTLPTGYPSSSGQVLSSTTTGEMSWVTAGGGGGGGGLVLIDSAEGSGLATIEFTGDWSQYYRLYLISQGGEALRVSTDNGSTWISSSYSRQSAEANSTSWSNSSTSSDTYFRIARTSGSTFSYTHIGANGFGSIQTSTIHTEGTRFNLYSGLLVTPDPITGLQLYRPSASISGSVALYGYLK